ncbi:MAG: hypothetical protein GXP08_18280 [Gammaproteobacteria bacterium]|nr:hypothetical protein [Gammaproteobacteria bacterium]
MGVDRADIASIKSNLLFKINDVNSIQKPDTVEPWYCSALANLTDYHRQYAIAQLLSELNRQAFFDGLAASAKARIALLVYTKGAASAEIVQYTSVSNASAFFCAIASGQWERVNRLIALTTAAFNPDYEYQDDYIYIQMLFELIKQNFSLSTAFNASLDAFISETQGSETPRYLICKAMVDHNEDAFFEALNQLVEEHKYTFEEKAGSAIEDHYEFRTDQYVFIEGLALKALGKQLGFVSDNVFLFLPIEADVTADA